MTLIQSLSDARRYAYRLGKYHLLSPKAPALPDLLAGRTAVIVGSAPLSTRPEGWDEGFRVVTVNASQVAARNWLTQTPDVTLMQFNQIEGQNTSAVETRRVLAGRRTGTLLVLHWRHDVERLKAGLRAFEYGYDNLRLVDRYERVALMHKVTGKLNLELDAATKWSNGIVAAALAIHSGASRVILTGIDPSSSGHAYNDLSLTRLHATPDLEALSLFTERGYPIFTADPHVSERLGVSLWKGRNNQTG